MFKPFGDAVAARFREMSTGELFVVSAEDIYERYLDAFPPGTNPMFRKRTEHDCNCCKQFIRRLGVVVGIRDNKLVTVWGDHDIPQPYKTVADALHAYISNRRVRSVFRTKEAGYGTEYNYDTQTRARHEHFHGKVSGRHRTNDADTQRGAMDGVFQVARRGLQEIRLKDLNTILELIASNELYRGEEFKPAILGFRDLLTAYRAAPDSDLFVWEHLENRNTRFRNTAIGGLFVALAEGKELDVAVRMFESQVAPANYKRPTAVITQRMVEQAVQTLTDLGLHGAIARRYARLSDVSVNDVLFVDGNTRGKMRDGVSELLADAVVKPTPDLRNAAAISADAFVRDVLPTAKSLQVLVENRHTGNFVCLTGGDGPERLFKWDNNFAWSYEGDVTDSVKQRVKAAGGNIAADLRVSLSWYNLDDLDLHADCPYGRVYFREKMGILDVDMNAGSGRTRNPVENLAFMKPRDGTYKIHVHQFAKRESEDVGFAIEVECGPVMRTFSYDKAVRDTVEAFTLKMVNGRLASLVTNLTEGTTSQEKWGIKTETLVPVTALMYSPNHWSGNAVGAKHLIFALQGCGNPNPTRGIYNEYLRSDLDKHRKVFEVLGSKSKCPPTADQIAGVGFTAARGDSVSVVVDGRRAYVLSF